MNRNSAMIGSWWTWTYISLLMAAIALGLWTAKPSPQDDFSLYQSFIVSLAHGKVDLSIPGFHGTDIFGLIVYLVTRSSIAQIYGLMIAAVFLPLWGFLAGRALFKDEWHGIALATIVAMMPFVSFVCLRGWTGPGYWTWMLLTIWAAARQSKWTGVFWALAILSKPFAIILLPLIIVLHANRKKNSPFSILHSPLLPPIVTAFCLVSLYLLLQFFEAGRLFIGAHTDMAVGSVIQSPVRILLNLGHALQILFSVHNYYFPNPGLTGPGNMMHTTPVLIFLGLFGLLSPRQYWEDLQMPAALMIGAVLGIGMNTLLDHMDHFYMEASVLLLILAALPVLKKHPLWIPLVIATLHFQWFYFWLQYQTGFHLTWAFWAVPLTVDLCWGGRRAARLLGVG